MKPKRMQTYLKSEELKKKGKRNLKKKKKETQTYEPTCLTYLLLINTYLLILAQQLSKSCIVSQKHPRFISVSPVRGTKWRQQSAKCNKEAKPNIGKKPSQNSTSSQPFYQDREGRSILPGGKCRRCGSTVHTLKDCKVASDVECRNCKKTGHLAKICASHIFNPLSAQQ